MDFIRIIRLIRAIVINERIIVIVIKGNESNSYQWMDCYCKLTRLTG